MHETRLYYDEPIRMFYRECEDGNNQILISIVDIVNVVAASDNPRKYWNVLKHRLGKTNPELIAEIEQVKMPGRKGGVRATDVAVSEVVIKLIEYIPSAKDEGEKVTSWIARQVGQSNSMLPLMRAAYTPGELQMYFKSLGEKDDMSLTRAELEYYRGDFKTAIKIAKEHLSDRNSYARGSAANIYTLGNVALQNPKSVERGLDIMKEVLEDAKEERDLELVSVMELMKDAILSGLGRKTINKSKLPRLVEQVPDGLRPWAWHLYCRRLLMDQEYEKVLGIVEVARTITVEKSPIQSAYLMCIEAVAMSNQGNEKKCRELLGTVFDLCAIDGVRAPVGDMQLIMPDIIDEQLKREWPDESEKMNSFTMALVKGVYLIKTMRTEKKEYYEGLSNKELRIATLAAKGWTNKEIATYLNYSENTIKRYLSICYEKLHIEGRKELSKHI